MRPALRTFARRPPIAPHLASHPNPGAITRRRCLATRASVPSPPAASSLPSTPGFAFDIDGVLLRGKALLPSATAALRKVTSVARGGAHATGVPHVYLTNGG